ncbi:Protein of unknown function [Pyronema omphalodes CBS 100304]|uniref:Uncharacterized protein n=1 Tax=Pyronema omphalodes (strain CBS 100304) TaxID=1076935 RepID=U4LXQ4_PYROM|nr:Protein of unknown function [Pyronema omphalodes CBS 100304]
MQRARRVMHPASASASSTMSPPKTHLLFFFAVVAFSLAIAFSSEFRALLSYYTPLTPGNRDIHRTPYQEDV